MDPSYVQATGWAPSHQVVHMDYSGYAGAHPPPFTSPPATPMTPMTPVTPHHAFTVPQYDLAPHGTHYAAHPPPQYSPPPDYRLFSLCQYLSNHTKVKDSDLKFWWEEFMSEFFHESATLVIEVDLGEGTRKFRLSRQWISFYFKSLLENGVTSLHLDLSDNNSTYHQGLLEMEFRNAVMETHHSSPQPTKVCTSGSLIVDFTLEEKPRIISWYFHINDHLEFVPRQTTSSEEPGLLGNITCRGLLPATQKLLFEAGLLDSSYHDNSQAVPSSTINTTGAVTSQSAACQWQQPPVPHLIAMPPTDILQPQQLTNGHGCLPQASPTCHSAAVQSMESSKVKLSRSSSCNKGKSPPQGGGACNGTTLNMMVAAEAVPLADATDLLSVFVGVDERKITKVHSQRQTTCSPLNKMDMPSTSYHANYNHSNGNIGGGPSQLSWVTDVHMKQKQITQ